MTLFLDDRRRAMLAEMGLRSWTLERPLSPAAPPTESGRAAARSGAAAAQQRVVTAPAATAQAGGEAAGLAGKGSMPAALPAVGAGRAVSWQALRDDVTGCAACALREGRRNPVLGTAAASARWLVVGEAPGESEDLLGTPFAGQEGLLLDNMLRALRLRRDRDVYLSHALKCRAPANRGAELDEVARCAEHLRDEVELLRPLVIVALGRLAVQALLPGSEPVGKLRGRVHDYRGTPVVVSYAPAYLLRNLPEKARAWADLCLAHAAATRQLRLAAG